MTKPPKYVKVLDGYYPSWGSKAPPLVRWIYGKVLAVNPESGGTLAIKWLDDRVPPARIIHWPSDRRYPNLTMVRGEESDVAEVLFS